MNERSLSVGLIGANDAKRLAITRELCGPQIGVLHDYYEYPTLDELSTFMAEQHDVVIIDMDMGTERALEFISHIRNDRVTTVMAYSAHATQDLVLRSLESGTHEFLTIPLAHGEIAGVSRPE